MSRTMLRNRFTCTPAINGTSPTNFCGLVTHQCNLFCGFCYDRKDVDPAKEMGFEEWKQALLSIKELAGDYFISFNGGEVMLMKWFPDLLHHCSENGIKGGVLTNGTAINEKTAPRLVAAEPFEIGLSADGPTAEVHDLIRGRKGSFAMVTQAVSLFRRERDRQGKKFPIIIRCVINKINLSSLPSMVDLVKEIGGTAIIFQPVHEITDKVMWDWQKRTGASSDSLRENFWIGNDQFDELDRVTDRRLELKKAGAPIMNTERDLSLLSYHFKRQKPQDMARTCTVSLRNFFIQPNGDVQFVTTGRRSATSASRAPRISGTAIMLKTYGGRQFTARSNAWSIAQPNVQFSKRFQWRCICFAMIKQ